ncbi:HBL153Wp [Eremothecium sinecaudum]|uniref:HBL153Wp n=1 Tax=Eremothecium sinecaudum TaxID=45286 RepID=A0A120K0W0_9SACH|nr:HBL153Wp [Eremothecium sinecaudum]AMD18749.1 HBL153Wp [Eremothecium sinecaudum]
MFTDVQVDTSHFPLSDKVTLPHHVLEYFINSTSNDPFQKSKPVTLVIEAYDRESMKTLRKTVVGVREFSLESQNSIVIPWLVAYKLDILNILDAVSIDYTLSEIPNGTSIQLEPIGIVKWDNLVRNPDSYADDNVDGQLSSNFIEHDAHVRTFLEASWNNTLTSIMAGEILLLSSRENGEISEDVYKFKVHNLAPAEVVGVVNVDLELEVLQSVRTNGKDDVDSAGQKIPLNNTIQEPNIVDVDIGSELSVLPGENTIYRITPSQPIKIRILENDDDESFQLVLGNIQLLSIDSFQESTLVSKSVESKAGKNSGAEIVLDTNSTSYIRPCFITAPKLPVYAFSISTTEHSQGLTIEDVKDNEILCPTCNKKISKNAYMLHEIHCQRSTQKCRQCRKRYYNTSKIPDTHWHCDYSDCEHSGDTFVSKESHIQWFHSQKICKGCNESFPSNVSLSTHNHLECPMAYHICKFCHLKSLREASTVESRYFGISGHEYRCGTKTVDCFKCGKPVRKMELDAHLELHEHDRKSRGRKLTLNKCANTNCYRILESFSNPYILCDVCYGPFYSTEEDAEGKKFKMKLERRYVIQLSRGCGFSHCKNSNCKSSGLVTFNNMKELLSHVQNNLLGHKIYWLCVDNPTTKRKISADILFDVLGNKYAIEWVYKAVNELNSTDLETVKAWLTNNAIANDEL